MKIVEVLNQDKVTLSFEVFPPKKMDDYTKVEEAAHQIASLHPDFMSITYGAGGGTSQYTVDLARDLYQRTGTEVIAHLTCVTSTREHVSHMIQSFKQAGIENIMALRGDIPKDGKVAHDYSYAYQLIREIKEQHLLPEYEDFEVYLDSPLAIEATKVFTMNMRDCFDREAMELVNSGINPLVFPGLHTSTTSDDSKMINFIEKPKVIISASGMCDAGRIRHHLKHNLWRPECTILFVGYQANGTLGRKLLEGEKNIRLFGEEIEVHARIESLHGVSGHADMNGLLKWIGAFRTPLERVFVVHGEDEVTDKFAATINEKFGCQTWAPYPCCEVDLLTNEVITEGVRIPVKAKKPAQRRADTAFERLIAAGKRLLDVIYSNEGLANKDKAKFESQINNLADKWEN